MNFPKFPPILFWSISFSVLIALESQAHDASYTGIKTKTYRSDHPNEYAFNEQQEQHPIHSIYMPYKTTKQRPEIHENQEDNGKQFSAYQPPNVLNSDGRLSANSQIDDIEIENFQHRRHYDRRQQEFYNKHRQNIYSESEYRTPIYNRERSADRRPVGNSQVEAIPTVLYTECPLNYTGQLPYSSDCRRFLNCWNGQGHLQSCAPGTMFNQNTLQCDRPGKVMCVNLNSINEAESEDQAARGADSIKTRLGPVFDNGVEHVKTLCPFGVDGLYPHPRDCAKFINCAHGNIHVQACAPGTVYNVIMKACDFKDKVDCGDRNVVVGASETRTSQYVHRLDEVTILSK